jgi:hypothetical protein
MHIDVSNVHVTGSHASTPPLRPRLMQSKPCKSAPSHCSPGEIAPSPQPAPPSVVDPPPDASASGDVAPVSVDAPPVSEVSVDSSPFAETEDDAADDAAVDALEVASLVWTPCEAPDVGPVLSSDVAESELVGGS